MNLAEPAQVLLVRVTGSAVAASPTGFRHLGSSSFDFFGGSTGLVGYYFDSTEIVPILRS